MGGNICVKVRVIMGRGASLAIAQKALDVQARRFPLIFFGRQNEGKYRETETGKISRGAPVIAIAGEK